MKLFIHIFFLTAIISISCDKEGSDDIRNPDEAVGFKISRDTINVGDTLIIKWTGLGVWDYDQSIFTAPIMAQFDAFPNTSYLIAAKPGSYSIIYNGITTVTKKITIRGGNWHEISDIEITGKLLRTESSLFLVGNSTVMRSNDFGQTWEKICNELPLNTSGKHEFRYSNVLNNAIYISVKKKMDDYNYDEIVTYKSIDNGTTWINADFQGKEPMFVLNNTMYESSCVFGSTLYKYSPDNNSWVNIGTEISSRRINILTSCNSELFAICSSVYDYDISELWRFNGTSWSSVEYSGIEGSLIYIFSNNLYQLFMITTKGFYKSVDNGENWMQISLEGEPSKYNIYNPYESLSPIVSYSYNNTLVININYAYQCDIINAYYPLTGGGGFISTDNGATWKAMGLLFTDNMIIHDNKVYATTGDGSTSKLICCFLSDFE